MRYMIKQSSGLQEVTKDMTDKPTHVRVWVDTKFFIDFTIRDRRKAERMYAALTRLFSAGMEHKQKMIKNSLGIYD